MAIARLTFSIRPDEKWEIVEVKSSIGVKDVHLYDLAFQLFVLTTAGLKIRRCVLVHINSDFIQNGEIDPEKFFTLKDATDQIVALSRSIEDKLGKMSAIM